MSKPEPSDEELRELFQGDRARDLEWVPSFERTVAARRASGRPALRLPALIALGAVLVAGAVFWRRADRSDEPSLALIQFVPGDLRTPTDFLLDVPGTEFLQM